MAVGQHRGLPRNSGIVLASLLLAVACGREPRPRSERSFDQIAGLVEGLSAEEVVALLGEPDMREPVFDGDVRWIWWHCTFLEGKPYPPEHRGRTVHLEIHFTHPRRATGTPGEPTLTIDPDFGAAYRLPESKSWRRVP